MARHRQEKTARFSLLFDEYPNLTETIPIFLFHYFILRRNISFFSLFLRVTVL